MSDTSSTSKPKPWLRRTRTIGLITVAVVAFLAWALRPTPIAADFAKATKGDIVVSIDDEGETRVRQIYIVSAPVAGRVERIELEVGDPVVAGETVLALFQPQDPALLDVRSKSEAEAGVRLAEAEQARAAAQLEFAQSDLRRQEQLLKEGNISQASFDRAKLQIKTAEAQLAQATASVVKRRADLDTSRAALAMAGRWSSGDVRIDYVPVRAPVDGKLLKRMQQSEALLAAGTPLLEIGDPRDLEIVTDLLSADAVKIKVGNDASIEDWGGPIPLAGKVKRIEPFGFTKVSALGIEEQRVNVIIDFTSPPEQWQSLGHGYRVQTRIIIEKKQGVVKVPVSALFRTGADWTVYVADGGTARLRKVTVGSRNTLDAEIVEGLKDGDTILLHPSDLIEDGTSIAERT
ncbi:MAG: efflux RND transporter periplasmic adaptor subunit [Alphaproteobacteria bacterium]|nr:efflux RND transporter periplasmic adaptor subunit [Alphaproteobacteria bacterium]